MAESFLKFEKGIVKLEQWTIFSLLSALIVILFIQVVFRFLLGLPLDWTEELARLLFTWLVYIGAAHALYTAQHFVVDFVLKLFPGGLVHILGYIIDIVTIAFIAYLAWFGFIGALSSRQTFPVLDIPVSVQTIALPVGLALMLVHAGSYLLSGRHIGDESSDPLNE